LSPHTLGGREPQSSAFFSTAAKPENKALLVTEELLSALTLGLCFYNADFDWFMGRRLCFYNADFDWFMGRISWKSGSPVTER
jgi:hypothetical protein